MATLTLNLSDKEDAALEELALLKDTTKTHILKQGLKLYQLLNKPMENGEPAASLINHMREEIILL